MDIGARLAEINGPQWDPDDEIQNGVDLDRGLLRVLGKVPRERLLGICRKMVRALDPYMRRRGERRDANLPWL